MSEILNKDEIRDKPICIVAVAGKKYLKFVDGDGPNLCRVKKKMYFGLG